MSWENKGHHGHQQNYSGGFNNQCVDNGQFAPHPQQQYRIMTAMGENKCLDVSTALSDKNKMIIWDYHGKKNQRYTFKMENGYYFIFSCQNGGTVQVPYGNKSTKVQVSQPNHAQNQKWYLVRPNKGQFVGHKSAFILKSFCGKALDITYYKNQNGTPVIQWDLNGQINQIWLIQPTYQGQLPPQFAPHPQQQYRIMTAMGENKCLDVSTALSDKNKMIIWDYHGKKNQRYTFKMENGYYFIFSCQNGGTVQVPYGNKSTKVQVSQPNHAQNQKWYLVRPNKGQFVGHKSAFILKSFCGKALDITYYKNQNGTPVIQWDLNGQVNQIWIIQPVV